MILMGAAIYFLPTIAALARGKRNAGAIFALNLLLGWTLAGWIIALVWALTRDPAPTALSAGCSGAPLYTGSPRVLAAGSGGQVYTASQVSARYCSSCGSELRANKGSF